MGAMSKLRWSHFLTDVETEDSEVIVITATGKGLGEGQYRMTVRILAASVTHKQYLSACVHVTSVGD